MVLGHRRHSAASKPKLSSITTETMQN
jgi:hypothetical protein